MSRGTMPHAGRAGGVRRGPAALPPIGRNDAAAAMSEAERKTFATLQARAALAGWRLDAVALPGGAVEYLASRWGNARALSSLAEVVSFLVTIGAPE